MENVDRLKKDFKSNLEKLIRKSNFDEARYMIKEYEKVIKNDFDLYSFKAVIEILENNFKEALKLLNEVLIFDSKNYEVLYNKAYLFEKTGRYKRSYALYKEIEKNSDNNDLKELSLSRIEYFEKEYEFINLEGEFLVLKVFDENEPIKLDYIKYMLKELGFTILDTKNNSKSNDNYILLYDLSASEMKIEEEILYDEIDNRRYFLINNLIKKVSGKFNDDYSERLYLSKNELETKKYIDEIFVCEINRIYSEVCKIEENYGTNYTIIKRFSGNALKAKTELIEYKGELAIKKTWKPGNERFFEREKIAYLELSKNNKYIPTLFEYGDNYIIIKYYEDVLEVSETNKKIILTNNIVSVADFFKKIYDAGYYNPDMHPGQFVYTKEFGLKAIDFEYLQAYEKKPDNFFESYDIVGYLDEFKGEKLDFLIDDIYSLYNDLWIKYTGYNLRQIADLVMNGKYEGEDTKVNKVLGLLNYAKTSGKSYNGGIYNSAYHSLRIKGYYFRGQRECDIRLQKVPYDFKNKTVLDIGCNAGGMLHALQSKIKNGIGIDYDYRLINAANSIKNINKSDNLSFYIFNLEEEELELVKNYILTENGRIDICFLLSVCMWISNWKKVIKLVHGISDNLLFETNGTEEQQVNQVEELKKYYNNIKVIEKESNDDPGQPNRYLLLCNNI